MRQLERLAYAIRKPQATHTRVATCEEADCQAQRGGWRSLIDETTDLGQQQAHYIRRESGRRFLEMKEPDGRTAFVFEPGQTCFAQHRVDLEREPFYLAHSTHRTSRRHTAETWVDDFATETDRLRTFVERNG